MIARSHRIPNMRNRRGAAVIVILLLILAVTGMGLMAIRQAQQGVTHGIVNTDSQRALQIADACAAGAIKALPPILDYYLMEWRETGTAPDMYDEDIDENFFGDEPFGWAPRTAQCIVRLEEVAEDAPAPGYSEGGGCFYRISLRATAVLGRTHASGVASSNIQQNQSNTVRQVIVRGLFGPASCD